MLCLCNANVHERGRVKLSEHIVALRGDGNREEFASRVGNRCSVTTVWRWETGRSIPRGLHAQNLERMGVPRAAIEAAAAEAAVRKAGGGEPVAAAS